MLRPVRCGLLLLVVMLSGCQFLSKGKGSRDGAPPSADGTPQAAPVDAPKPEAGAGPKPEAPVRRTGETPTASFPLGANGNPARTERECKQFDRRMTWDNGACFFATEEFALLPNAAESLAEFPNETYLSLEVQGDHVLSLNSHGLVLSKDGGRTWKYLSAGVWVDRHLQSEAHFFGDRMVTNGQDGLGISTDEGQTWTWQGKHGHYVHVEGSRLVTFSPNVSFSDDGGANWRTATVAEGLHSDAPRSLFSQGTTHYAGFYGAISKSVDDGLSWQTVASIPDGSTLDPLVLGFVAARGKVFAVVRPGGAGGKCALYEETDSSWLKLPLDADYCASAATDGERIYVGARTKIFATADGGQSWTSKDLGYSYPINSEVQKVRADRGKVYAASSAGLFTSSDQGETWKMTAAAKQIPGSAFALEIFGRDFFLFGNVITDSTSMSAAEFWSFRPTTNATSFWLNNRRGSVDMLTFARQGDRLLALHDDLDSDQVLLKDSADQGRTWSDDLLSSASCTPLVPITNSVRSAFATSGDAALIGRPEGLIRWTRRDGACRLLTEKDGLPAGRVAFLSAEGEVVVAGGPNGLARSADGGLTWQAIGQSLEHLRYLRSVVAAGNRILIATSFGGFDLSADAGQTWRHLGEETGVAVRQVVAAAIARDTVAISHTDDSGSGRGVAVSSDGGVTWRNYEGAHQGGGAPRFLKIAGRTIFAGTMAGLEVLNPPVPVRTASPR